MAQPQPVHQQQADAVAKRLRELYAVSLKRQWVAGTVAALAARHPDLPGWPPQRLADAVFEQFLFCDMNVAGQPCLPQGVQVGEGGGASGVVGCV